MIGSFEIILIIVVLGLLVITVAVSIKSTKGTSAITALKIYLNGLQLKFNDSAAIDAERERSSIETLFNNIKVSCEPHIISSDTDLESKLSMAYKQISAIRKLYSDEPNCSWLKFKSVAAGFTASYFPGFVV